MTDSIRGNGLSRVLNALDKLEADPSRLDQVRVRFSQPPPSYVSNPSGTTTRTASPEPSGDERRRMEQREYRFREYRKLMDERAASFPREQFKAQRIEETRRIWNADPRTNWMSESKIPIAGGEKEEAIRIVKERWIEQGIWKDEWNEIATGRYIDGRWKHEEPFEPESELETVTEARSPPSTFSFMSAPQKDPQPKPRRPKSDGEKRHIAERRAVRKREHEASRPYHQFVYQISKERERIQEESTDNEGDAAAEINTTAYENIKNTWIKRGIWNGRWGILPGMSWKHEQPIEEIASKYPDFLPAIPLQNGSHNDRVSPKSPSTSNSPRPTTGEQALRHATRKTSRTSRKPLSKKNEQQRQVESASLGPIHSSKISKATERKRPASKRRRNASPEISSGNPPSSSGPDVAESPYKTTSKPLRRSKRLEPSESSTAKGPNENTSTNSLKGTARSRPKRNGTSNQKSTSTSSAKPQGVSKRPRSTRPRRKA